MLILSVAALWCLAPVAVAGGEALNVYVLDGPVFHYASGDVVATDVVEQAPGYWAIEVTLGAAAAARWNVLARQRADQWVMVFAGHEPVGWARVVPETGRLRIEGPFSHAGAAAAAMRQRLAAD